MSGTAGVIKLELARAEDMFETPTVTLGSTAGGTIAGIDRCLAELTAHPLRPPVHLELELPEAEITPGTGASVVTTLQRYCDEHHRHNENQIRGMKRSGWRALRVGFPITLLGLTIVAIGGDMSKSDPFQDVVDIVGWVLAWLGLWYPFDKVVFYPTDLVRENRALAVLRTATVSVVPRSESTSH
ncbi:MAG TPA: hypothetical protein VGN59_10175 [Acidimicrobiia bacterium]|jgi:hypothetical protein